MYVYIYIYIYIHAEDASKNDKKDEENNTPKQLYIPTAEQEEKLREISVFCEATCKKLGVHGDVDFIDPLQCVDVLAALTVDLAGVLKFSVIEAKGMSDDIEENEVCVCVCVCVSIRKDPHTSICM